MAHVLFRYWGHFLRSLCFSREADIELHCADKKSGRNDAAPTIERFTDAVWLVTVLHETQLCFARIARAGHCEGVDGRKRSTAKRQHAVMKRTLQCTVLSFDQSVGCTSLTLFFLDISSNVRFASFSIPCFFFSFPLLCFFFCFLHTTH